MGVTSTTPAWYAQGPGLQPYTTGLVGHEEVYGKAMVVKGNEMGLCGNQIAHHDATVIVPG